jgi:sugar lactone lactonase YvrE
MTTYLNRSVLLLTTFISSAALSANAQERPQLEKVFEDPTYQLTGVAATTTGRIFVNYPYWLDKHEYSVVEVGKDGKATPYPDASWNSFKKGEDGKNKFVCVQAVVADDKNYLWIVDPAGIGLSEVYQESNKVIKINLKNNKVERIYRFPNSVAGKDSYINDIRIDNKHGFAYLTSSSNGGIVILNIRNGESRFVLNGHPSTLSDESYKFSIKGNNLPKADGTNAKINSDGIALSPDKLYLYYKPLTDNKLYRISTNVLMDFKSTQQDIADKVEDVGRFVSTDGMEFDEDGNLYLGDLENSRIIKISPDLQQHTLVEDDRKLIWPDSYSIADGYLYISCSQIQYMPWFNSGQNKTQLPYSVYRLKIK